MFNIPSFEKYNGEMKIALLDNSAISFMEQISRQGVLIEKLFRNYDIILVPNWVLEEVKDSIYRFDYIVSLIEQGFPIYSVFEERYADFVYGEEGNLYKIVLASVSMQSALKSYVHRYVEKQDPLDMDAYENWIHNMYEQWPLSTSITESGRIKKKNAGELSLTILAEIISWYYPKVESITIYTQDRDTYEYQNKAHELLRKQFIAKTSVEVSFLSNDSLLYNMYKMRMIELCEIERFRKDVRRVIFTQKRADQSVALSSMPVDNKQFIALLKNNNVQIIF